MKFGVREICDVVFKAKADTRIGNTLFKKGQPVLFIDSAKTSTVEGAATTVYAQGGKGNTRLIAWEGEKTLTFTVEDALLSPIGFSILSGAGLFKSDKEEDTVHVHKTATVFADANGVIDLTDVLAEEKTNKDGEVIAAAEIVDATAPVNVIVMEQGDLFGSAVTGMTVAEDGKSISGSIKDKSVFVDFYVTKKSANVSELQIDAEHFAGYYYVEASTLFRRQSDGVDMPAEITLPNVKIQSNFTFSMASTGDPSTFTFTMDAFPGYTMFDNRKKVLCVMQVVEDAEAGNAARHSVMGHDQGYSIEESEPEFDSTEDYGEGKKN